jgi:hypothetical protein
LGIAVPAIAAYVCGGPEGKRARDLVPAARQAPEPARRTVGVNSFSEEASAALAAYPLLLDKNTPLRNWSREAMFGAETRAEWREPDRVALPF